MERKPATHEDFRIPSLTDLEQFCKKLSQTLPDAAIVLLSGPLGAGKTKFVETMLKTLGYTGVSSPTFTIHQSYVTKKINVEHFDFYRVQNIDEIEGTGFWDILSQPRAWIFIEWPDKIVFNHLPAHFSVFDLSIRVDGEVRTFTLRAYAA
jgi:tRNA threonylcarbamoyladenosine biosynthesis protein TsaE